MKSAVIVTVYKRYNYVMQAIQSVLRQSVLPDQVIIVADNINEIRREVPLPSKISNLTVIESNYPQYGRMISSAVDNLDDIDVVFFLDDDDMFKSNKIEYIKKIFEKNDNVIMVHNHQEYIDDNGNIIENSFTKTLNQNQPHKELVINSSNILFIYKHYPGIFFNNSSISIRKYVLDKYKSFISNIELSLDIALLFISLLEGNVLHVPSKLTYYRVGSGLTSYGKFDDYTKFLENERKIACTGNRHLEDLRKISQVISNCNSCKAIIDAEILFKETYLYLLRGYFNCSYETEIPSYFSLLFKDVKCFFKKEISLSEFMLRLAMISLPMIIGRKKAAELYLKKKFNRYTGNNR